MIQYNNEIYKKMFGNIDAEAVNAAVSCMSQCTGCTCACRCSCYGGKISTVQWNF